MIGVAALASQLRPGDTRPAINTAVTFPMLPCNFVSDTVCDTVFNTMDDGSEDTRVRSADRVTNLRYLATSKKNTQCNVNVSPSLGEVNVTFEEV